MAIAETQQEAHSGSVAEIKLDVIKRMVGLALAQISFFLLVGILVKLL